MARVIVTVVIEDFNDTDGAAAVVYEVRPGDDVVRVTTQAAADAAGVALDRWFGRRP